MKHHYHAVLLGILIASSAAAQQFLITSVSNYVDSRWPRFTTYAVTYVTTGSYSGLKFRLDLLNGDWHTFCFNWNREDWTNEYLPATNTVLFPDPQLWLSTKPNLFFHAVSSWVELVPTVTTNRVTFTNDTLSLVSNIWLGLWGNHSIEDVITVTSLPPHSVSSAHDYILPDLTSNIHSENWGWFQGGYMLDGVDKQLSFNWVYTGPLFCPRIVRLTGSSFVIE